MESGLFYQSTLSIFMLITILFIVWFTKYNVLYSLKIILYATNVCITSHIRTLTLSGLFLLLMLF